MIVQKLTLERLNELILEVWEETELKRNTPAAYAKPPRSLCCFLQTIFPEDTIAPAPKGSKEALQEG